MQPLRWGLIGGGDIAQKRVAAALADSPRSELVAVSRRQAELAEEFASRVGARRWYAGWEDLLRDTGVSAVYIATPVHLHAPMAVAAAEAGKHVLCEKPMALDVAECDRMLHAARGSGVKLGVAYYRRFYPVLRRARQLIGQGAIGEPVVVHADALERFDPDPEHPRRWLLDPARSGGGPMFDFGCHRIEVFLHLLGPAAGARGMVTNAVLRDRDVEDTAHATLRFRRGCLASLTVSHAAAEARDALSIFGSAGSIHIPALNAGELHLVSGASRSVEQHPPHTNLHQPLVEQFVAAVLDGGEPAVDGGTGREVNRLLAEIYGQSDSDRAPG